MTAREKLGMVKAYKYAMMKAAEAVKLEEEYRNLLKSGMDNVEAAITLRRFDIARGEAFGIAHALALINGVMTKNEYSAAIYKQLGE